MSQIYLDHAASTPIDPRVAQAMADCLLDTSLVGNSSSSHQFGYAAAQKIKNARLQLAQLINALPENLVFTSGATESDNLAIFGVAYARSNFGRHIITARTEHKAVLDPFRALAKEGFLVTWLDTDANGKINPQQLQAALRPETQLVSIMHANNEIGVLQDIAVLAAICREKGILFHCDAAQSVGKVAVDVQAMSVDLLSISAHKIYGPKGIGALYVAPHARAWINPLILGGGQERGLRSGTLATHQIIGFGMAAQIAQQELVADAKHTGQLAAYLKNLLKGISGLYFNGATQMNLPALLSISVEGVEGESLMAALPQLALSSGAACDSAVLEPSYVLRALGLPPGLAQSTLRISLGRQNTKREIEITAAQIGIAVQSLRARDLPGAPLGEGWHLGEAGSLSMGTRVRCYLRISAQCVRDVQFRIFGCPHTIAVAEQLRSVWVGQNFTTALESGVLGTPAQWAQAANVPTEKLGRLLLIEDAMRLATLAAGS